MGPNNGINAYEEIRNQRMEENRRRMEELKLTMFSQGFSEACNSGSKSSKKPYKPRTPKREKITVTVRRSSRVASIPAPDYREVTLEIPGARRSYGYRSLLPRIYASDIARSEAIEAAAKIEKDLGSGHPSFLKPMLQSHVSGGFWLGLPSQFCSIHMPKRDERMILEDEDGEEFDTLFLSGKTGLSAGWRGFSIAHELADGDCLVFQMVEPKRFKVYIVRAAAFESGTTSEELVSERDDLQILSVDVNKELLAKENSNQKKRKTNSMAEVETPKPKARDSKKVSKNSGKEENVVLESQIMDESQKLKSKVKTGKKIAKKSEEESEGQMSKLKAKDGLKSKEESESQKSKSKAKDGKRVLKKSGEMDNSIRVSEKQYDCQKSGAMSKNILSKREQVSRPAARTMSKSGSKGDVKLPSMLPIRKTGIQTDLKTLKASPQIMVVE